MATNGQDQTEQQQQAAPAPAALAPRPGDDALEMGFGSGAAFALLQRAATVLANSSLMPPQYQGNISNCIILLNMATRMRADPLMCAQNLYLVHNKPGWSAKYLIATVNQNGDFSKLRYEWKGEPNTPEWGCRAWAVEKSTKVRLDGPWITWKMANDEGWVNKSGSKWKTMPVKMFMYRAGAWFVDLYAPELSMGLPTREDLEDITDLEMVESEPGVYSAARPEPEDDESADQADDLAQLKANRQGGVVPKVDVENAPDACGKDGRCTYVAGHGGKHSFEPGEEDETSRQPGDESEEGGAAPTAAMSAAQAKVQRERIEILCTKLDGVRGYDLIGEITEKAGKKTRKIKDIPVESLHAVETRLADEVAAAE